MYPTYGIGHIHSLFFLMFFAFFGLLINIIVLIPFWFVFKKAGFSPFLALLMFLPIINIVLLYFLAFSRWNVVPAAQVYPGPPPVPYQPRP